MRTVAEAKRAVITDLRTAKAAAMKAGSLPEANAIEAAIRRTAAELDLLEGRTTTIANSPAVKSAAIAPPATPTTRPPAPAGKPAARASGRGGNGGVLVSAARSYLAQRRSR